MARLSASLLALLVCLSGSIAPVAAQLDCDNTCFFSTFTGGPCTNDPACMCDQTADREAYFCCLGDKCGAQVLADSISRQSYDCGQRNMPFSFDAEAVCGIKLTLPSYADAEGNGSPSTTAAVSASPTTSTSSNDSGRPVAVSSSSTTTPPTTNNSKSSTASAPPTIAVSSTSTTSSSSTGSQTSGSGGKSTPTPTPAAKPNSATPLVGRATLKNIAILGAVLGMLL